MTYSAKGPFLNSVVAGGAWLPAPDRTARAATGYALSRGSPGALEPRSPGAVRLWHEGPAEAVQSASAPLIPLIPLITPPDLAH
jgi:hypothetical protein